MAFALFVVLLFSLQFTDDIEFAHKDRIEIPSDIVISVIEQVDVDASGNMLITDSSTGAVVLYTALNGSFKKLDSTQCHPGFSHQPIRTVFTGNEIWMMHAHSQVFRFSGQGECIGAVDSMFLVPQLFGGRAETVLAGFLPRNFNLREPIVKLYSEDTKTIKEIDLGDHIIAPVMSFRFHGGGIIAHESNIFIATSSSPAIYEVNNTTVNTYLPEYAEMNYTIDDDISGNNNMMPSLIEQIHQYRNRNTTVRNLFKLNNNFLALNIIMPESHEEKLVLFDLNNRTFTDIKYSLNDFEYIDHISDDKAYIITENTTQEDIDWVIDIYDIRLKE